MSSVVAFLANQVLVCAFLFVKRDYYLLYHDIEEVWISDIAFSIAVDWLCCIFW